MMKAEELIGTVLGTCELQRLIGRGGLGAVYLAQQSRPRRQVAVKVFSPATTLKPDQLTTFLERFRREIDVAASLEHPNILPVHEFGEQDGIVYLVMPYISGGTLRDVIKQEGRVTFPIVVNFLEQIADAIDYAHEQGIIHRDIKPANILLTPEGRLLLTDFGLVKVMTEGQATHTRLSGAGISMGTPDYMAPEQILGGKVDERSDIYSLGIILYEMVTGTVPFRGDTAMQIAVKHLRIPPQPPRLLCPHLPLAAEQVMLQALAKRSADRYTRAQDLATAFRLALTVAGISLDELPGQQCEVDDATIPRISTIQNAANIAEKRVNTAATSNNGRSKDNTSFAPATPTAPKKYAFRRDSKEVATDEERNWSPALRTSEQVGEAYPLEHNTSDEYPSVQEDVSSLTYSDQPTENDQSQAIAISTFNEQPTEKTATATGALSREPETGPQEKSSHPDNIELPETPLSYDPVSPLPSPSDTSTMGGAGEDQLNSSISGKTGSVKLSAPVKVVQVPVTGQPGVFVTGLLPVLPETQSEPETRSFFSKHMKAFALLAALLLIVFGSGAYWLSSLHDGHIGKQISPAHLTATPDLHATMTAQVIATLNANTILFDPLSQNIHGWPVATSGSKLYIFENGAYHITANDPGESAPAILPGEILQQPFGYSLTMEEIRGDDTSVNNAFGMIIRFNNQSKGGRILSSFYSFEVVNRKGGEYQFWKYDNGQAGGNPWKQLWQHAFGPEFHQGHGPSSTNTLKIFANGKNFTLIVNGKQITTLQDGSIASGSVGMLVNLKGTEVAFSNLRLAHS